MVGGIRLVTPGIGRQSGRMVDDIQAEHGHEHGERQQRAALFGEMEALESKLRRQLGIAEKTR